MSDSMKHAGTRFGRGTPTAFAAALLLAGCVLSTGCEVDSFMDPSKTGRFEYEPTTIPVLDRLDLIEPQEEYWARAQPPTTEDLMPRDLAYYIYPGDVVTTSIYELTTPNQYTTTTRRVDTSGFYRIPEMGDVRAAGLTAQQFEDEIKRVLRARMMSSPQVDVVVEQGAGLRFTVSGFVQRTGPYTLDNPNLRLMEALASAGGIPVTTERVYIIRQVVVSPDVQPSFERDDPPATSLTPGQQPTQPEPNIDELIRQLEGTEQNPPAQPTEPQTVPPAAQPETPPADEPVPGNTNGSTNGANLNGNGANHVDQSMPEPPVSAEPQIVDIDQLEPVRTPAEPPVDVDVVRPESTQSDDRPDSFIYIPERGEWVRVPGSPVNGSPSPSAPLAQPSTSVPAQSLTRVIIVDYSRLRKGDATQDIVIRPGDSIYVDGPAQGYIYIDGEVNRVGVYQLPASGTLTLSRAITSAGGLGAIAIPSRVDLTRRIGHNREATIRLDLAAIRQRTEPDVVIKPDDHIIVGTTFWATPLAIIRNGFRATYGFGFLLDRNFGNDVFGAPPGEGNNFF